MKAKELLDELVKMDGVLSLHKIEIQVQSPTGTPYSINDIALNPSIGRLVIRTKRTRRSK